MFLLFAVVIGSLCVFYLKGPSSCGSYETGDKRKGWILRAVSWYRAWLHKEFYVQRNIYDCHELGPKKSVSMGIERITDSFNKSEKINE